MPQRSGYTRCLLSIAIAFALIITILWYANLMTLRSALALLGSSWEALGAFTLVASLFFHQLGLYKLQEQLLEANKAKPTDWIIRRFPVWVAFHFGQEEAALGHEDPIDTFAALFWGTLLLVLGFFIQAVSYLPWLDSGPQTVTLTVSQMPSWKHWAIGLFFSVVVGHFIVEPFLDLLRSWRDIQKPERPSIPSWLTGAMERLFFTVVIGFWGIWSTERFPSDILTGMFAWLALKMAANWNREVSPVKELTGSRPAGAISALLAGLVSMLFAFFGGLMCRGFTFGLE